MRSIDAAGTPGFYELSVPAENARTMVPIRFVLMVGGPNNCVSVRAILK